MWTIAIYDADDLPPGGRSSTATAVSPHPSLGEEVVPTFRQRLRGSGNLGVDYRCLADGRLRAVDLNGRHFADGVAVEDVLVMVVARAARTAGMIEA